ncbi:LysR family transcriptional regulator [Arthrobacter sp. ATA002]|uniref:LysR family transcriptional regulator n=1 Tax=Arthrobacter sp. ATA002 TaxID=2991715 RepID=UPI0022A79214|nr:LysR family transcriptional regulator [Arthrobacter sp. ATA002]WAP50673.1 LysR family transcriptional regulator [Arthrobacter sp. ATA002]
MEVELRHLRSLIGVVEAGTFTDAGIDLGISQTAVSRNIAALESILGVRLLHRTTRSVEPTAAGERVIRHARRVLSTISDLQQEVSAGASTLRIGYAWSALGKHTPELQRRWAAALPHNDLRLIRTNTPTAGLAEGTADFAVLRRVPDATGITLVQIAFEKRYCAMSIDDPLARKSTVTLAHIPTIPVVMDNGTGSTRPDLWPDGQQPEHTISTHDVDDWLTIISSGTARGVTAESTAHQYRREGLTYRRVRDAPPVPIYAAWPTTDPPAALQEILTLLTDLYL